MLYFIQIRIQQPIINYKHLILNILILKKNIEAISKINSNKFSSFVTKQF